MFRRETIIALKARQQAFRVACDVAHARLRAQPPPESNLPRAEVVASGPPLAYFAEPSYVYTAPPDDPPPSGLFTVVTDVLFSLIGIAAGVGVILLVKYG